MRTLIFLSVLVCLAVSPVGAGNPALWLIPPHARFHPDALVFQEEHTEASGQPTLEQIEMGTVKDVAYHFEFSTGFGRFAGAPSTRRPVVAPAHQTAQWIVGCTHDPIDDTKACYLYIHDLRVVLLRSRGRLHPIVSIGWQHYPGTPVAIRLNTAPAFLGTETMFDLQTSARIVEGLTTNPFVVTRYQQWPNDSKTDHAFQVFGFAEAYAYLRWAMAQTASRAPAYVAHTETCQQLDLIALQAIDAREKGVPMVTFLRTLQGQQRLTPKAVQVIRSVQDLPMTQGAIRGPYDNSCDVPRPDLLR